MKNSLRFLSLLLFVIGTYVSCSEDESDSYPSLITEMAMVKVDASKHGTMLTDAGVAYRVSNELTALRAKSLSRALCGYVLNEDGSVKLYSYQGVRILQDYTKKIEEQKRDPVAFVSSWRGGSFVNLHLLPKTQGQLSTHVWGFIEDGKYGNSAGGTTYQLSLQHDQGKDPLAYSNDLYLSLSLDSIDEKFSNKDSIELTIKTFESVKTMKFGK